MNFISKTMVEVLTVAGLVALGTVPIQAAPFQNNTGPKTSDNQSNNKADVDLTAQIRKEIVADKSLSTNAHNIKIISQNGAVTVRGDVDSATEKATVLQIARKIAGAANVMDDVTVATPKNR